MRSPQTGETPSPRKQEANGSRGAAQLGLGQALLAYAWPVAASMPARRPSTMVRPQAKPVNRFG